MTTFTDILGAIGQDATQPVGATKWSDLDKVFAEQAAATEPGATPGSSASEQEAMAGAAKAYEDSLLIPEPPTAVKALTLGLNLREVERGLRTQVAQAAQAVATPGLRAKFIESVVNPLLAVAYPYMKPVNDLVIPEMAKAASMAMEPADSGLTTADLPTELLAARGAAQGMAAGQAEGIMADISRAVGQSIPQTAAVGATILTGGGAAPVVLSNLASQALIPFSAWTAGQLSYMDELDAVRAQEALEGRPLTQFDPDEMQRRGIASGAIQTGTEAIGAGIAGRAIGRIAARATALRPAKAVVGALAERGAPIVGRALATRGGQAAGQAFARATAGAMRFNKGFFGQAAKIVAISAAEEGAEELGAAILESPFTFAPLGDDLKQGIYSAFIGSVAGGAGGGAAVISTAARKGLVNRADAFRPENDREIALRQQHTEAMKARTNWTADLDETQQAEVAVALNSLNGMDPAQRGEYLRELADQRADIAAKVESLLALRQDLDAALAGAQSIEAEAALQAAQAERQAAEELQQEAEAARAVVRPRVQRPGRRAPTGAALEQQVTEAGAMAEQARAAEEAALARAVEVEVAPGVRVDPKQSAAEVRSMIEETDAELRMLVTDRLLADAKYGAVREKLSDLPMDFRQEEPAQVLSGLSASTGVSIAEAKAPKRGGRVQKELEALGMRVVWFKATGKPFGSPAFHTMSSRGTVYLNVDADMSHVRARAYEEMFHDIQMFRPDVAQAYSEAVGVESSYAAGEKYARGRPESRAKGVMDTFARIQAAAAEAGVAGEQVELPAPVSRIGAARLEQEGQANAFAEAAARVTGAGPLRALMRSAARRGLMGREVAGAMAVIDTVSRAAAVERVNGVKPVATLSPLARTLLWAEDMAVDLPAAVEQAVQPAPAPAPAPAAPGISMARDLSTIWEVSVSPDIATFEEAHVGGIADLGNEDSKYLVSLIPDYESKIAGVRNAIRRVLGESFKLYRSMSKAQLESWKNGEDVGPMSGTANRSLAERFVNLAAVRDKNRVIVEVDVTPEMIVLRGSENESELVFDANEISADQVRVVSAPSAPGISMARASDADYLAAVERGDMESAQRMVDAAAKAAGYKVGPVYHGTKRRFEKFESKRDAAGLIYFSEDREFAARWPVGFGGHRDPEPDVVARIDAARKASRELTTPLFEKLETEYGSWKKVPDDRATDILEQGRAFERTLLDGMTVSEAQSEMGIRVITAYLNADRVFDPSTQANEFVAEVAKMFGVSEDGLTPDIKKLMNDGAYLIWENPVVVNAVLDKYDAIRLQETSGQPARTIAVRDNWRIKSADPVTRDEAGNVIPLSRRFDVSRPEISFARPSDADYLAAVERGDMETAQRMVDDAAIEAGYTVGPVYHGTFAKFNEFDLYRATGNDLGFHFGDNAAAENRLFDLRQEQPQRFAKAEQRILRVRLRMENPLRLQETRRNAWQMKDVLAQIFDGDTVLPGFEQDLDAYFGDELESRVGGKLVSYADLSDNRADENEWLGNFLLDNGYDGIVYENRVEGGTSYIVYDPNRIKLADPVTRDEAGNVIPLSKRFDVSRPEISFARPQEDAETTALREEVSALRAQADELRRQMRDVQNVTAAQRVNAMREVRVLERRIVTAERLAEQKTLQATRAKMRLDLERQAAQEDIRAAEDVAAKMAVRLDEVQASVRSMRSELASLRRGERVEERLAQAEEESQRAIDFAYAIGRNEGLLAGEVRGQQVERRQVRKLSERLDVVQARLDKAIPALRESRAQIKDDAKAAQRAIDFAYGMGLAKGRLQGVMEGRRQVLARMARREDTLQNQLFNLRKTAEARAEAKESVQDAVRQIALDAARMLPERLRGPLATRIAQAKTLAQANRVAVEAVKVAANNEVAQSIDAIRTLRKRIGKRGMTYATRTAVERLLDDAESGLRTATGRRIRAAVQTARGSAPALVNAVEVYAAVVDASAKVEQAVLMYDMDRQRYLALRAQRIARYDALRQRLAQDMSGRPTLSDRERADQPPGLPLARAVSRANSDIYTLMLELEGTEMGVIGEMLMEAQAGKGESSLEHATILRGFQPALQAAGYESIDEYALRNGLLGQSSAQVRDVTLGRRTVSLPLGTIISIAAMDDETLALFPEATNDGQSITFRGAETTTLIRPSKAEIRALRSGLSAGERGLIDAMKNVLETQIRDRVMDAVFAVEGDQPPVVANYWPRVRLSKQKADASILNASAGTLVRGALTNVGFANARTGGTEPLVYDDAFKTWERHVQVALDMIHMAQPYRTAATVLTDPAVVEGMDRQMGQGTAERVLAIFSNGVGATARSNPTVIDKFTNNVTGAILAMRPKTLAKVLIGGQIRLASELPVGLLARGSARAARRLANPRAWDARVEEIHSLNGYFARRHQLHMRSIVSGSLSDADRVRVTTAFSAMIDGFRAAGQSIAAAKLTDALAGFRDASNGANMMIASVVDALRYMDEQIMLTAVEARLIEVEDEGIRTGQDALREAALRAERDFRRTQNASDEFDDVSFAAHARVKGQTGLRIFFPFSSDPLKARNQIRRAYLSGDRRLQTAGAIAGNAASSTIIGLASIATVGYIASLVSGILGGTGPEDEEEKKFMEQAKRLPASVSAEVLSSTLGYAGIIMGQVVQGMQYRRPLFAPLVGRPIEQAGRELTSADPWYARMVTSLLAISQYAGFPMYGLYQFVREQFDGSPAAKEKVKPEPKTPAERLRDRIERRRRELQNIGK